MTGIKRELRQSSAEVDADGTWAISYGDMVTLLLTFFILFFNINKESDAAKLLQESLLAKLSSQVVRKPASTPDEKKPQLSDINVGQTQGRGVEENLLNDFGGSVQKVGSRLVVEFPAISFYRFGETRLTRAGAAALDKFAKVYVPYAGSHQIVVRSYTDGKKVMAVPGRLFKDNLELSALRSLSAIRALQSSGIPLDRMRTGGFGELKRAPTVLREEALKASADARGNPWARKVVLIIEPQPKEGI